MCRNEWNVTHGRPARARAGLRTRLARFRSLSDVPAEVANTGASGACPTLKVHSARAMPGERGRCPSTVGALRRAPLAAAELPGYAHTRARTELDVFPREPNRLADSQAGMGQELEEQPPVLGDFSEQRGQHDGRQRPRPVVGVVVPAAIRTPTVGLILTVPSSSPRPKSSAAYASASNSSSES